MRGQQRYRCKACGLNFTDTPPRGKPLALKVAAVLLYVSGLSMNRTAKLLGVSTPTIQAWMVGVETPSNLAVRFMDKPLTYSSTAATFRASGLPRGGVSVKFRPQALHR